MKVGTRAAAIDVRIMTASDHPSAGAASPASPSDARKLVPSFHQFAKPVAKTLSIVGSSRRQATSLARRRRLRP
jgi:hypothetical protein